ncbi:ComEC/Rec2 family competence protein, partial [Paenibacillus lupini]
MVTLKILPAYDGDCLIINFGQDDNKRNILIDGGRGATYSYLKKAIIAIDTKKEFIDLLVVTHIDRDHIQGIITLFKDNEINKATIKKVWFNSGKKLLRFFGENDEDAENREIIINNSPEVSINQGISFESLLETYSLYDDTIIYSPMMIPLEGARLTILSPDIECLSKLNSAWQIEQMGDEVNVSRTSNQEYDQTLRELLENDFVEDASIPNGSSIAFLFEYCDQKVLFLGDSFPSVIEKELRDLGYSVENKLRVNAIKISHHASKYNTSSSLLEMIECENFIISTNGMKHG